MFYSWNQEIKDINKTLRKVIKIMSVLVSKKAPDFTATAVLGNNEIDENFNLTKYLNGDIGVLFFWPLDFTFVCPSEIIAFNKRLADFQARGVKVIGVSTDSHFTHLAWKNTAIKEGGIGQVQYPMVADLKKSISRDYDVLFDDSIAFRGTFLIDGDGIVRHQLVNDLPLGRNIDEALRMVDALLFHNKHGEVCPAGWNKGDEGMAASPEGVSTYLEKHESDL